MLRDGRVPFLLALLTGSGLFLLAWLFTPSSSNTEIVSGSVPVPSFANMSDRAQYLNALFMNNTTKICAKNELFCSGVYVHMADNTGGGWTPEYVNHSVSFSLLRAESAQPAYFNVYRGWDIPPPNGFIYYPDDKDILCAFPFDGNSYQRRDCGCGTVKFADAPELKHKCVAGVDDPFPSFGRSNQCHDLEIADPKRYVEETFTKNASFPFRLRFAAYINELMQCTFAPSQWNAFLKVNALTKSPRYRWYTHGIGDWIGAAGWNEILIKTQKNRWDNVTFLYKDTLGECLTGDSERLILVGDYLQAEQPPFYSCAPPAPPPFPPSLPRPPSFPPSPHLPPHPMSPP